jgi:hypothetical protein
MRSVIVMATIFLAMYGANERWTLLTPSGTPPSGRWGAASVYDSITDRFIVWGGGTWSGVFNDLYALDSTATGNGVWRRLTATGPVPSGRGVMGYVYDKPRRRMIIFCGYDMAGSCNNQVYFLDSLHTSTPRWSYPTIGGTRPTARQSSAAAYDPIKQRMLIFSGWCGFSWYDDVYAIENLATTPTWSRLYPAGTSSGGRWGATCDYDFNRDRLIIFGGQNPSQSYPTDVWAIDSLQAGSGRYRVVSTSGTRPLGRMWLTSTYDSPNSRMLFFGGGYFQGSQFNDLWALNMASTPAVWSQLSPTGTVPSTRYAPSYALDAGRRRLIVFGGYGGVDYNDVYTLTWTVGVDEERTAHIGHPTVSARPNPFRRNIALRFSSGHDRVTSVTVFDFLGRKVKAISPADGSMSRPIVWNGEDDSGSDLPAGTYFVVFQTACGPTIKRIVKID